MAVWEAAHAKDEIEEAANRLRQLIDAKWARLVDHYDGDDDAASRDVKGDYEAVTLLENAALNRR